MQTSLPSPLLQYTAHSHFIIAVSKQAISRVFAIFFICVPQSFFLKSEVMEEPSALYFWDQQTPIQSVANPQKHWTLHVYIHSGH